MDKVISSLLTGDLSKGIKLGGVPITPSALNKTSMGAVDRMIAEKYPEVARLRREAYRQAYEQQGNIVEYATEVVTKGESLTQAIILKVGDMEGHDELSESLLCMYPVMIVDEQFNQMTYNEICATLLFNAVVTPHRRKEYVMDDSVTKMYPDKIDVSGIELVDKEDQGGKAPEQ